MIKNERQYRITKSQADKFASALSDLAARPSNEPLMAELESNALRSQLDELQQQLREYDELRSGVRSVIPVKSFDELPNALVQARIAAGLSQKELADRLGIKEQQVQRYESTGYHSASLARIREVVCALDVKVDKEILLPHTPQSPASLFNRLGAAGIDREFALRRLLPPAIAQRLESKSSTPSETELRLAATTIGRVFHWRADEVLGMTPLRLKSEAAGIARFKLPARADERKLSAYTVYAHYLALLILQATPGLEQRVIPIDAEDCREAILNEQGAVTFDKVLRYLWDLGIPVLPLTDSGAFHGAFWRVNGRNVIVLKQRTMSLARWTNDALHEAFHAGQEPEEKERSVIEESEMSPERRDSDEEQEATIFSGDVILDGRAEELAKMCVEAAGGRVERLKGVVPMVAECEGVDVGALANYMAFRLSLQDINWWGTAANLQVGSGSPWQIARDFLIPRLDLCRLNEVDRQILQLALTDMEK